MEESIRKVVQKGGPEAAKADVLTLAELRSLKYIVAADGIDRPHALANKKNGVGIDSSSAYVIVDRLRKKKFAEINGANKIVPTQMAVEVRRLIIVGRTPTPCPVDGPIRTQKVGGDGKIEAHDESDERGMHTHEVTPGTWTHIPVKKGAEAQIKFRMATGTWGVVRVESSNQDFY